MLELLADSAPVSHHENIWMYYRCQALQDCLHHSESMWLSEKEWNDGRHTAQLLLEKHCEKTKPVHMGFLDLEMTFNHNPHNTNLACPMISQCSWSLHSMDSTIVLWCHCHGPICSRNIASLLHQHRSTLDVGTFTSAICPLHGYYDAWLPITPSMVTSLCQQRLLSE